MNPPPNVTMQLPRDHQLRDARTEQPHYSSSPQMIRSPRGVLQPQSPMIHMHIEEFVHVVGHIMGVRAAMAEMNTKLSPAGLINQAAQMLIEEGLHLPAALLQEQLLTWEREKPPNDDEQAVENAVTMGCNDASDEGEPTVPPEDLEHHPSQSMAFATAHAQLNDLPDLGLGLLHHDRAVPPINDQVPSADNAAPPATNTNPAVNNIIQQNNNLLDKVDEVLSHG